MRVKGAWEYRRDREDEPDRGGGAAAVRRLDGVGRLLRWRRGCPGDDAGRAVHREASGEVRRHRVRGRLPAAVARRVVRDGLPGGVDGRVVRVGESGRGRGRLGHRDGEARGGGPGRVRRGDRVDLRDRGRRRRAGDRPGGGVEGEPRGERRRHRPRRDRAAAHARHVGRDGRVHRVGGIGVRVVKAGGGLEAAPGTAAARKERGRGEEREEGTGDDAGGHPVGVMATFPSWVPGGRGNLRPEAHNDPCHGGCRWGSPQVDFPRRVPTRQGRRGRVAREPPPYFSSAARNSSFVSTWYQPAAALVAKSFSGARPGLHGLAELLPDRRHELLPLRPGEPEPSGRLAVPELHHHVERVDGRDGGRLRGLVLPLHRLVEERLRLDRIGFTPSRLSVEVAEPFQLAVERAGERLVLLREVLRRRPDARVLALLVRRDEARGAGEVLLDQLPPPRSGRTRPGRATCPPGACRPARVPGCPRRRSRTTRATRDPSAGEGSSEPGRRPERRSPRGGGGAPRGGPGCGRGRSSPEYPPEKTEGRIPFRRAAPVASWRRGRDSNPRIRLPRLLV